MIWRRVVSSNKVTLLPSHLLPTFIWKSCCCWLSRKLVLSSFARALCAPKCSHSRHQGLRAYILKRVALGTRMKCSSYKNFMTKRLVTPGSLYLQIEWILIQSHPGPNSKQRFDASNGNFVDINNEMRHFTYQ